jgi:hypothetical protein
LRQPLRPTPPRAWTGALAVAAVMLAGSPTRAADVPLAPPPLVPTPPATAAPSPPSDAAPPAPAPVLDASPAPAASAPGVTERRLPTLDATAAESDHDTVRDSWGVQVRPVAARLSVFGLRAGTGCPAALASAPSGGTVPATCPPVTISALAARRWIGRNVAIDGGMAMAFGGGSDGGRLLDTYFGLGPVIGAAVLLGNWRHVAVMAGPELTFVAFKGAGSADTAYLVELLGSVEAELHFGFIGAPALSLGVRSGLAFRLEHAVDATLWSVGVGGATTVRALFEDVALRYYF